MIIRQEQGPFDTYPEILGGHTQSSHCREVLYGLVQSSENICNAKGTALITD